LFFGSRRIHPVGFYDRLIVLFAKPEPDATMTMTTIPPSPAAALNTSANANTNTFTSTLKANNSHIDANSIHRRVYHPINFDVILSSSGSDSGYSPPEPESNLI
jgi:hypothetical protein